MTIERLSSNHDRSAFCCGKPLLDDFLRKFATQYDKKNYGRTYVAVGDTAPTVLGYYTISTGLVEFCELPEETRRKLPKHPAPVVHLGRLAVDQSMHGKGVGSLLLADALRRATALSEQAGIFAVEVRAIDAAARAFYLHHGFVALIDDPLHLYIAISTLKKLFATPPPASS